MLPSGPQGADILKILVGIIFLWLSLGAAGSFLVDLKRPFTLSDIVAGPITLGHELERQDSP